MKDSPPLIVRISGIPADTLTGFSSPDCVQAESRLSTLRERLGEARAALVEHLHTVIQGALPDQRRDLLALKRDSFNGRELRGFRNHSRWSQFAQLAGAPAEHALKAEEEAEKAREEFLKVYESRRDLEQQHLKRLVREPSLLRGLAFGSPELLVNLQRFLSASRQSAGRRERRLELSTLRYVSRTAVKPSPFSSLTPIGVARLQPSGEALRFAGQDEWRELSTVHLQRFLVEQVAGLLLHHGAFRAGLLVKLNPTLERLGDDSYRFLRPGGWVCPAGEEVLERRQPALVRGKLGGPLFEYLHAEPGSSGRIYRDLLADLVREFPAQPPERLRESLDRFLGTGLLYFESPWSRPVIASVTLLAEYLDRVEDVSLEPLRAELRQVVDALRVDNLLKFRAESLAESRVHIRKVLEGASNLVGKRLEIKDARKEWMFYEDVFLTSVRPTTEILDIPSPKVQKILDDMDVLVRLSNLGHSRYEFLHTLSAFAAARWPAAGKISFLDLFEAALPMYQQYTSQEREARQQSPPRRRAFNPMGLQEIDELCRHRESVAEALDRCLADKGEDVEIDMSRARDILSGAPRPYVEPRDFAVFVQALQPAGDSWVLNAVVEGAGRFESRHTLIMPAGLQEEWSSRYVARSNLDRGCGVAEIVDLFSPMDNTVDLHVPLTRRVIDFSGQPTGLPPDRRLLLRDLWVGFEGARLPWLLDGEERRILPMHLGAQGFRFLPAVHRFLALFGTSALRRRLPVRDWRQVGDVQVTQRHWVGNLVYQRRTWACELGSLKSEMAGRTDSEAFQKISRWRLAQDLPDRVFVVDPILSKDLGALQKPQYIDFTSCLFVVLFRTILEKSMGRLKIVEALPGPEDGLPRACGGCWAAEFLVDADATSPTRDRA